MKILGAIRGCVGHGTLGGMELITHNVYKGLVKRGIEVDVVTSCKKKNDKEIFSEKIDGVCYYYLPTGEPRQYSINYHKEVKRFFEEHHDSYALIFSTSGGGASLTKNEYGVPVIVCWHGTFLEEELDKVYKYQYQDGKTLSAFNVERLVVSTILPKIFNGIMQEYQSFDHHVVISSYMRDIVKCYGIPDKNITLIPNSVSDDFFNPECVTDKDLAKKSFGIPSSKKCIGFVGRMGSEKGEGTVKKLAEILDPNDYSFFFVGADINSSFFEDIGFDVIKVKLKHEQMPSAYAAIDIFINPTLRLSGLDMTVAESCIMDNDVIVSDLPQYVLFSKEFDLNIKFFKIGDSDSLRSAIENPTSKPLSPDAKAYFSEKTMLDNYESLLRRVAKPY